MQKNRPRWGLPLVFAAITVAASAGVLLQPRPAEAHGIPWAQAIYKVCPSGPPTGTKRVYYCDGHSQLVLGTAETACFDFQVFREC